MRTSVDIRQVWHILIADDNMDDRMDVRRLLLQGSERRYRFVEVETGAEAIRAILDVKPDGPPDCAIIDYLLPDLDASEVLAAVTGPTEGLAVIPVIVLTSLVARDVGRKVLRAGAQDFMCKSSITAETLTRAVENAIDRFALARQLHVRELELRTLADNTPDILTRFDSKLRYVFVNAAIENVTGRSRDEFLGKTSRELDMPPELCDCWQAALRSVFATGQPQSIMFTYPAVDGERHYSCRLLPETGRDGQVTHVLGVTHDVTERERYERALREAAQRKDEFLATLAHELRNPLAPIRTGLDMLELVSNDAAARTRALQVMKRQITHLVRLVDDLLDVSRISRGLLALQRERLQLCDIVEHAVESSIPFIQASSHTLHVRVPEEPIWVDGDLTRLAQVLSNLLNNAAKYTGAGGRIELTVARDGSEVVIRVADNGIGISAEQLTHIFDLFAQADTTRDHVQGGLGIGLSLVRKLVEMHGGTVAAASAGLGQGSVFTVHLPAVLPACMPAGARAEGDAAAAAPPPRRVLVVDDNQDAAEMLAEMLRLSGHDTRVAYDGAGAIAVAHSFSPQVVFLDLGMPGMDGFEVAHHLRNEHALAPEGVLVALTGWGSDNDKRRTEGAGFDFHLTKPVDFCTIEHILCEPSKSRIRR